MQVPAEAARILRRIHVSQKFDISDIDRLIVLYIEQPRFVLSIVARAILFGRVSTRALNFTTSYLTARTDDKSRTLVFALLRFCLKLSKNKNPDYPERIVSNKKLEHLINQMLDHVFDGSKEFPLLNVIAGDFVGLTWVLRELCAYLNALGQNGMTTKLLEIWADWENALRDRADTLALAQTFYEDIGHSVILQSLRLAQKQGMLIDRKMTVSPGIKPHNDGLCRMLAPEYSSPSPGSHFEQISGYKPYRLSDGRVIGVAELISETLDRHFKAGGGPALPLDERIRTTAESVLRDAGLRLQEPFVTLHVREAGFAPSSARATQTRNADILAYVRAIRLLVKSGYRVVRMGDRTMRQLPEMSGVLDYPFSIAKSEEADLYLVSKCAFHVGTSSGLSLMPLLFDRPVLFTNWMPIGDEVWSRRTLFLTKKIRALSGQFMPVDDVRAHFPSLYRPEHMVAAGFYPIDNTPEELVGAVSQMIAFVNGGGIHQCCSGPVDVSVSN